MFAGLHRRHRQPDSPGGAGQPDLPDPPAVQLPNAGPGSGPRSGDTRPEVFVIQVSRSPGLADSRDDRRLHGERYSGRAVRNPAPGGIGLRRSDDGRLLPTRDDALPPITTAPARSREPTLSLGESPQPGNSRRRHRSAQPEP